MPKLTDVVVNCVLIVSIIHPFSANFKFQISLLHIGFLCIRREYEGLRSLTVKCAKEGHYSRHGD